MNRLILASASPRRRELLRQIGLEFEVMESGCEETVGKLPPRDAVCRLSARKAEQVRDRIAGGDGVVVVGADTVVAFEDRILGKPADEEDARAMLRMLSGNTHRVYTGVTLCYGEGCRKSRTFYEMTGVTLYPLSEEEIRDYVRTGEPLDKAGAYGIQGCFAAYVKGIKGDYNNVVGLPVGRLYQELKDLEV